MARKEALIGRLREMAGTPSELAAALGVEASDRTFSRALKDLEADGTLVAEGSTRDRRYRNTTRRDVDGELLACLPCPAHEFSRIGHTLGLYGRVLGARKLALGIETYKGEDGKWWCRYTEGYRGPQADRRPSHEDWARMSARASKGGKTIAGKSKGDG